MENSTSKSRKFRKTITFSCKLLIVIYTLITYLYTLFEFYEPVLFIRYGNVVLLLLYFIIFVLFAATYGCFKVGVLRRKEVIYSYGLTIVITNVIVYFVQSLIARQMLNPLMMLLMTVVQIIGGAVLYMLANKVYFKVYPARDCIVICSDKEKDAGIIERFQRLRERYKICMICNEDIGYDELVKNIGHYSTVILCNKDTTLQHRIMAYCYEQNKRLFVVPSIYDIMLNSAHKTQIGDEIVFLMKNRGPSTEQLIVKRAMDIVVSLIGLVICSPFMLITALCIKLQDGGKVFFKQKRFTLDGRVFTLIKFRSMVEDAEKDGKPHMAEIDDKRITKVGKIIRAIRFDETPQFINILKGDMSLVGPRAERTEHVDEFAKEYPEIRYRNKVKAGLTGYAQVYGKYNTPLEEKLKMDLLYIENYSLLLDFKILLFTVKILFMKESTEGAKNMDADKAE